MTLPAMFQDGEKTATDEPDRRQAASCPRCHAYRSALQETVDVLLKTKNAFKSRTIATLRRRLQQLLHSSL